MKTCSSANQVKPLILSNGSAQVTTVDYTSSSAVSVSELSKAPVQAKPPVTFSVPVKTVKSAAMTESSNQVKPLTACSFSVSAPRPAQPVKTIEQSMEEHTEKSHEHLVFKKLSKMLTFDTMLDNADEESEKVKKLIANCEATLMSCLRIAAMVFLVTNHFKWALFAIAVEWINNQQKNDN